MSKTDNSEFILNNINKYNIFIEKINEIFEIGSTDSESEYSEEVSEQESESGTGSKQESRSESETGSETGSETESGQEIESQSGSESSSEIDAETEESFKKLLTGLGSDLAIIIIMTIYLNDKYIYEILLNSILEYKISISKSDLQRIEKIVKDEKSKFYLKLFSKIYN